MRQKSVLLLGSYGQTNVGDDILMYNYLSLLKDRGFTHIYVNASNRENIPDVIKREFLDLKVKLTYETSLIDWIKTMRKVSLVVYGGGTIYKELYSSTGRGKYSVIIRMMVFNILARLMGAKIYNLNIGIGVLKTGLGRTVTNLALRAATMSYFRDGRSYLFAKQTLQLPVNKIKLSTDGLFISDRWQKPWHEAGLNLPAGPHKRVVGVNLLSDIPDWIDRKKYIKAGVDFVAKLAENKDNLVLLIPFQHDFNLNNDRDFMRRELAQLLIDSKNIVLLNGLPIDRAVAIYKKLDVLVGMRFHSLLLATITETPFVGLSYDTKCKRFLKENNYKYAIDLEDLTEPALTAMFKALVSNTHAVREELRKISQTQLNEGSKCLSELTF